MARKRPPVADGSPSSPRNRAQCCAVRRAARGRSAGDRSMDEWTAWLGPSHLGPGQIALRLGAALASACLIGLDRELKHKPLGLRTNMLMALGSASFSVIVVELIHQSAPGPNASPIDAGRVLEGIIGGIGFLGAGRDHPGARPHHRRDHRRRHLAGRRDRRRLRLRLLPPRHPDHAARPVRDDGAGLHHQGPAGRLSARRLVG